MHFITTLALFVLSLPAWARDVQPRPDFEVLQVTKGISLDRGYTIAGLFGGNNPEISRRLASGAIGCPTSEIGIANEDTHRGIHTFTAHCKGREYFCTFKHPAPIACSQTTGTTDADVEDRREEIAKGMIAWKEEVLEKLSQAWVKPNVYSGTQRILMKVKIDERGRLLNLQWILRSGNGVIDKSILKAFKNVDPYPVPPDPGQAFSGVEFSFP